MSEMHILAKRVTITTGENDDIYFADSGGNKTATVAAGSYYMKGDGSADDLLEAVKDALNTASVDTISVGAAAVEQIMGQASAAFGIDIALASSNAAFSLKFAEAETTFDPLLLGWPASNTSAGATQTAPQAPVGLWYPDQPASADEPEPEIVGEHVETVGGKHYGSVRGDERDRLRLTWRFLDGARIYNRWRSAARGESFQDFRDTLGPADPFGVLTVDSTSDLIDLTGVTLTKIGDYVLGPAAFGRLAAPRQERQDLRPLILDLLGWTA